MFKPPMPFGSLRSRTRNSCPLPPGRACLLHAALHILLNAELLCSKPDYTVVQDFLDFTGRR